MKKTQKLKFEDLTANQLSIKLLLALTMADIDIFLLQDEAQKKDLEKLHTKEAIREQLEKSMIKALSLFDNSPMASFIDEPILPALVYKRLVDAGFSKKEIEMYRRNANNQNSI